MKIKLSQKEQVAVTAPQHVWSGFNGTLVGIEVKGLKAYGLVKGKFHVPRYAYSTPASIESPEKIHKIRLDLLKPDSTGLWKR